MLKNLSISNQLWIVRLCECVEFVDTNQRMLVGCVTMQKLMLHETGELAEFGNVTAEEIDAMHHSQDAPNSAFLCQNRFKDLAWAASILIRTSNVPEAS